MAKVTIDGIEVEVQDGINVIEAAKAADVHVPHFCYHPSLSIVGQCRMCLVEVEGMPKLQAGCATPVKDGMKIAVWNDKVDKARKGQMEFLLINHPLDCPICDKAGECPLQDYSFNYGSVDSRYGEFKRTYPGMDRTAIGPHVDPEHEPLHPLHALHPLHGRDHRHERAGVLQAAARRPKWASSPARRSTTG